MPLPFGTVDGKTNIGQSQVSSFNSWPIQGPLPNAGIVSYAGCLSIQGNYDFFFLPLSLPCSSATPIMKIWVYMDLPCSNRGPCMAATRCFGPRLLQPLPGPWITFKNKMDHISQAYLGPTKAQIYIDSPAKYQQDDLLISSSSGGFWPLSLLVG